MAEDVENQDSRSIDNQLLLAALRETRRDQREINELLLEQTKHVAGIEPRPAKRLPSASLMETRP